MDWIKDRRRIRELEEKLKVMFERKDHYKKKYGEKKNAEREFEVDRKALEALGKELQEAKENGETLQAKFKSLEGNFKEKEKKKEAEFKEAARTYNLDHEIWG